MKLITFLSIFCPLFINAAHIIDTTCIEKQSCEKVLQKKCYEQEFLQKKREEQCTALWKAVENNDCGHAHALLQENPNLKTLCHTEEGTPLHIVKSLAMAHLLVNEFGFNPNSCDELGDRSSQSLSKTDPEWFISSQEQQRIIEFLIDRESSGTKKNATFPCNEYWNQLKSNKVLQVKISLYGMGAALASGWTYLLYLSLLKGKL